MLELIRRSATSFVAWVILGVIVLVFGLSFGLPSDSLTFGAQPIARVHGTSIAEEDYQYQFNLTTRIVPIPKDLKFQELMGLKEEILDAVVERLVLSNVAEDIGLEATSSDAEDLTLEGMLIVLGDTFPWLGDNKFNYDMFRRGLLASLQISEPKYLEQQRREILARTLRDLAASGLAVAEPEIRAAYEERANQLSLRYVRFESAGYAQLVDIEPEEAKRYLQTHEDELAREFERQGARFTKLPKQAKIRLVAVKKPPLPSDDADETTRKQHAKALADAREKLVTARAHVLAGQDLRQVARATSEHTSSAPSGGDYGWTSVEGTGTGLDPAVDEVLSKLAVGELSHAIEGHDALYLVRVEGRREGNVPRDEAMLELAQEAFARERGKALARQSAEEALLAIKHGKTLSELFKLPDALANQAHGIEELPHSEVGEEPGPDDKPQIRITGLFARTNPIPGIGPNPELTKAAWEADSHAEVIERVFETADGFVIAGVERKHTASDEGYAQARADIYRELAEQKALKVTSRFAARQCLEAKGRGEISPNEKKIEKLMTYDTKLAVDESGKRMLRPYQVCDRVGGRGGMLRAGMTARAGGGDAE